MNDYFERIGLFHGNRAGLAYVLGFAGSLLLTLAAYVLATNHVLVNKGAALGLAGLALVVVLILVSGSIWILWHLDARMMPSTQEMQAYVNDQPGI